MFSFVKNALNSKKVPAAFCALFSLAALILSCKDNVGLGMQVDTEVPSVDITYPPASSRINGTFTLAGSCDDDISVASVKVQRLDSSKVSVLDEYEAVVSEDKQSWSLSIDTTQITDGQYYFRAYSVDTSAHNSANADSFYEIDNTAPVLVLTKPTSFGTNTAKGYGQVVALEGTFSEQGNAISELVVSFYSVDGTKLFDSSFTDINDMSSANPLIIARYYDSEEDRSREENLQRWNNYKNLFGEENIAAFDRGDAVESVQFYMTVTAFDDTRTWNDASLSSGSGRGNETTCFYRGTTDMLNLIEGRNSDFDGFTVYALRNYLNGTDRSWEENPESEAVLKSILSAAESESIISTESVSDIASDTSTWLTFQINPRNNPSFTVSGFALDTGTSDLDNYSTHGYRKYYADSALNLTVSTGLDNTNLDTSTISIYFVRNEDASDKKLLWTWNEDVAVAYAKSLDDSLSDEEAREAVRSSPETYRYTLTSSGENTDSLSKSTAITSDAVKTGLEYEFVAEGQDIDGQPLIASSDAVYGFFAATTASPAVISVSDEAGKQNLPNLSVITEEDFTTADTFGLSGTIASSGSTLVKVTAVVTITDGTNSGRTASTEGTDETAPKEVPVDFSFEETVGSKNIYSWNYFVSATSAMQTLLATEGYYIVTVEIKANNGQESVVNRTYYLDNKAPSVSVLGVNGTIVAGDGVSCDYYINPDKSFTISGITQDNYSTDNTTILRLFAPSSQTAFYEKENVKPSWSVTLPDNFDWPSDDYITAKLTAKDSAGNESDVTELVFEFDRTAPVLDNSGGYTDYVTNTFADISKWYQKETVRSAGTFIEQGSGIDSVYYMVVQEGGSAPSDAQAVIDGGSYFNTSDKGTFETFSQDIAGFADGMNRVYYVAVDKVGNKASPEEVVVYVDTTLPRICEIPEDDTTEITIDSETKAAKEFRTAFDATILTDGENARNVYFYVTDSGNNTENFSGVAQTVDGIKVKIGSTVVSSASVTKSIVSVSTSVVHETEIWTKALVKLTLTASSMSSLSGYNSVSVIVPDYAGNNSEYTAVTTLNIDKKAPEPSITSHKNNSVVNKTVTVSGKATDNNEVESISVTAVGNGTTKTYSSESGAVSFEDGIWSVSVATTDFYTGTETKNLRLSATATDTAGNTSDPESVTVVINQQTDRPVITLMNMKSSGGTLTSRMINGSVYDDDGTVGESDFEVSEDGVTWISDSDAKLTYANGSFTYTVPELNENDQGERNLYFRVKDAAGTTFTHDASSVLKKPFVRGNTYASDSSDEGTMLSYTLDTNPPEIISCTVTGTVSNEYVSGEVLENGMVFGKNHSDFTLTVNAKDTSGIASISAKFGTLSAVTQSVSGSTDNTPVEKTLSMTVPDSEDYSGASLDIVVTVTDTNNSSATFTRTVLVDNTAPSITVKSPSANTQVVGETEVRGIATDGSGAGVKMFGYCIPSNQQIASWSTMSDEAKIALFKILSDDSGNNTTSWSISFTDSETSSTEGKLSQFFYSSVETVEGEEVVVWHNKKSAEDTATYGTEIVDETTGEGAEIWELPVYFYILDGAGNYTFRTDYALNVNPDGDRPTAGISYPAETDYDNYNAETGASDGYITLGGNIRVFGTAEDNESVSEVYLQIQKASYDENGELTSTYADIGGYENTKASGTTNWSYTIDGTSTTFGAPAEFADADTDGLDDEQGWESGVNYFNKSRIRFRARAVDNNETKGSFTDWIYITIDKSAPRIGSTNPLMLVQYSDNENGSGTQTASKVYESGMYISGIWWLTCSVEDESGIEEVSVQSPVVSGTGASAESSLETGDPQEISTGMTGYNIKVKLDTSGTGSVKFNLYAKDKSQPFQTSTASVYLKFDNEAPVQGDLYHGDSLVGDGSEETVKVQQDNYTFLVKSSVTEAGSGLERAAMFFKRTGSGTTRLYDPRFEVTNGDDTAYNKIVVDGSSVKIDSTGAVNNGLPYRTCTVTRFSSESFTLTTADKFITKGSLVKIAGVYRLISEADGTTYKFTPEDTSLSTSVDVIYALIIDNTKVETITNGVAGGDGEDGDLFYDQVTDEGSAYSWKAAFDSGNIPDGPLSICYVSFDSAANASELKTVSTFVSNNAPRIAKVYLGTDLSGDGSVSSDETVAYSVLEDNPDGYQETVSSADIDAITNSSASANFTAKDKTELWAEIIGGNNSLYYEWKYQTGTENSGTITWNETKVTGKAIDSSDLDASIVQTSASSVTMTVKKLVNGKEKNVTEAVKTKRAVITHAVTSGNTPTLAGIADGYVKVTYTFWDGTEETVPGTTSQSATVSAAFTVDVVDDTAPKTVIQPFFWKSRSNNSLFANSTANGHIELESDWTAKEEGESDAYLAEGYKKYKAEEEGYTGTEYDEDPKVSGKISVRGTSYDNTRLTEFWVHIDDFAFSELASATEFGFGANGTATAASSGATYYKVASYNTAANEWEGSGNAELENGWQFKAVDSYLNQDGHSVTWQLDFDTSQIENSAGANKVIRVIAVDGRSSVGNASSESASGTDSDGKTVYNKPSYQVDVVPYITDVSTALSSLKKNNPSVYNRTALGHYPVRYDKDTASNCETITITGFNLAEDGSTSLTKTIGTDITVSGAFEVTVNSVKSLNNVNYDNAKGSYSTEETLDTVTGTYSVYLNYYNRQPNNDNNNLLTDDVVMDVWEINPKAVVPISGVASQPVMAINPDNHDVGFAFVNGALYYSMPNGSTYSYDNFIGGFDYWTSVTMAYDSLGNSYGTAAGGDINETKADQFRIMTSRWGYADRHAGGYNKATNQLRLELIGQYDYMETANAEGVHEGFRNFDKERIRSPSLTTGTASSDSTSVYLAYYDAINDEIRFKWGEFKTTKDKTWKNLSSADKTASLFGDYYGLESSEATDKVLADGNDYSKYRTVHNSWLAGQTSRIYNTSGDTRDAKVITTGGDPVYAGQYVSIAAIPGGGTNDDAVVAVWWDAENNQLLYSYNLTPKSIAVGQYTQADTKWTTPVPVFDSNIGEYCKVAVIKEGAGSPAHYSVHIVGYDGLNCDVWYAYMPNFTSPSSKKTCLVDSYGLIGTELNLDVALDDSGNAVPYISYYAGSCAHPKTAHWAGTTSISAATVVNGAGDDECFTGKWEISVIPTKSRVSVDHTNIGVWKDSAGAVTWSTTDGAEPESDESNIGETALDYKEVFTEGGNTGYKTGGHVYGNGSKNAILGYAVTKGSSGYIETAQMR